MASQTSLVLNQCLAGDPGKLVNPCDSRFSSNCSIYILVGDEVNQTFMEEVMAGN